MAIIVCPECGKSVSSEAPNCPSCGHPIKPPPAPEKKTGLWWGLGCLLAVPALLMIVAIVGLLAAIAIPSFVRARETSQLHACIANMRQIDSAKQALALAINAENGTEMDATAVNKYLKGSATPICPAGGTYTYNAVGRPPGCSRHGVLGATASSGHSSPPPL
jgi:type II secretory pathway pseudopilin PulG